MATYKPFDTSKKILITGAAGFIGFHLAKRLLDMGTTVLGLDNLNDYYDVSLKESRLHILEDYPAFTFVKGDLADADTVNEQFETFQPDIVVNLAAQAGVRYSIDHPRSYIDSNIIGFFNILEACRHHRVEHLLFASSSSVYGNQQKTPFSTSDNVDHPISLYAATKKSDELMAYTYSHLYGIPATGLRFFTVYGPYGRPDMAYFKFANRIRKGEPIQIYNHGDMYRDFTYVDDIVTGLNTCFAIHLKPMNWETCTKYIILAIINRNNSCILLKYWNMHWARRQKKNTCPCSREMYIRPTQMSRICRKTLILNRKQQLKKDWENLLSGIKSIMV